MPLQAGFIHLPLTYLESKEPNLSLNWLLELLHLSIVRCHGNDNERCDWRWCVTVWGVGRQGGSLLQLWCHDGKRKVGGKAKELREWGKLKLIRGIFWILKPVAKCRTSPFPSEEEVLPGRSQSTTHRPSTSNTASLIVQMLVQMTSGPLLIAYKILWSRHNLMDGLR